MAENIVISDLGKKLLNPKSIILPTNSSYTIGGLTISVIEWYVPSLHKDMDSDMKNKSPEDQKGIFRTFVRKIVVYDSRIDTDTIVSFDGGVEGNGKTATPLQRANWFDRFVAVRYLR